MRHLSTDELKSLAALCAGMAFFLGIAVIFSGCAKLLPQSVTVAVSTIRQTAATANAAAVPYWQTTSNGNYGGYPSPTACTINYNGGTPPANCFQNFPGGIVSALLTASSQGTYTSGRYNAAGYAPCYPSTGWWHPAGFVSEGVAPAIAALPGATVQLDWSCQPSQRFTAILACGDPVDAWTTSMYTSSYLTDSSGATYLPGANPIIGSANIITSGAAGSTKYYYLYCSAGGVNTRNATVPVTISNAVLALTPVSSVVPYGGSTNLNWSVDKAIPASCKITNSQTGAVLYQDPGTTNNFAYTGGNQSYQVPSGVTSLLVKLWGAGGGGASCTNGYGGNGGYTEGVLSVTPSQVLTVIAGQKGSLAAGRTYGGGGTGGTNAASGGGRSAVRDAAGNELMTAGGGGGVGSNSSFSCTALDSGRGGLASVGDILASIALWPPRIAQASGPHLAGGGGFFSSPGYSGGGLSGANIGGASPYAGADGNTNYGGGGGGYVGGATAASLFSGGNGGTGYCGSATGCTTTTGAGSAPGANGQGSITTGQSSGSVSTGALTTATTFALACQDYGGGFVSVPATVSIATAAPTATISAGAGNGVGVTIYNGQSVTITATYTAANPDIFTATTITGPNTTANSLVSQGSPFSPKSYVYTPTQPGSYIFYPSVQSSAYPAWNNYGASVTVTVLNPCPNGQGTAGSCTSCNAGYVLQGGNCVLQCPNGQGPAGSCTSCNNPYVLQGGNCVLPSGNITAQLTATPARVHSGTASSLSWTTTGMSSCTVKNDAGTTLSTALSSPGVSTGNLTRKSVFALSCTDGVRTYASSATVTLVPVFKEI